MSSTKPLMFVLGAGLLLSAGACQQKDETPLGPGTGYMPGTPGGNPDGGNTGADGGVALGRPCTTAGGCEGACSDGGTFCAGNCGFLAPVAYQFPTSAGLGDLVAVDVDGDGYEDLLTVNNLDEAVALLRNQGDGTFAAPALIPASKPDALRVEDLDGDGVKDLAVVSGTSGTLSIHPGNGNGSFRAPASIAVGSGASELVVAPLDGTGGLDIAVLRSDAGELVLMRGAGDGSFQESGRIELPGSMSSLLAADLTVDGRMDLAFSGPSECDGGSTCSQVSVLRGNGDGTFLPEQLTLVSGQVGGQVVGELNVDARPDLVLATGEEDGGTALVLLGLGDGTFRPTFSYAAGRNPRSPVLADIDRDGVPDLLVLEQEDDQVGLYLGRQDGSFSPRVPLRATSLASPRPYKMVASDFDKDGKQDLAVITRTNFLHLLWGTCR